MSIVGDICAAIQRNPQINRVIVPARELEQIRKEFDDMTFVKPQLRPTYGPPFGNIDRQLWDAMQAERKLSEIRILGRLVTAHVQT